jgi:hypothetical protein
MTARPEFIFGVWQEPPPADPAVDAGRSGKEGREERDSAGGKLEGRREEEEEEEDDDSPLLCVVQSADRRAGHQLGSQEVRTLTGVYQGMVQFIG